MDLSSIGGAVGGILKVFLIGAIILAVIGLVVFLLVWSYKRKKWFLKVIVKLPRAGNATFSEIAKGRYDVKEGIVDIKRKGVKPVGMKPMDIRTYLQGTNTIEVMQLSPTDFIPIHPDSYKEITAKNKKGVESKYAVIDLKTDLLNRKTWKNYMERSAKNRFTLSGFLDAHWRAIELGIIVFIMFIGFAVLWSKLPTA